MPSLLINNPPPPLSGDKMSKTPMIPPEIPLAKGGIKTNIAPPMPILDSLSKKVPNLRLPPMPPPPVQ